MAQQTCVLAYFTALIIESIIQNFGVIIVTDLVRKFACAVLLGRLSKLIKELCVLHEAAAEGSTAASRSTC